MKQRCLWASNASLLIQDYHDNSWGISVRDDVPLFKFLVMESAHAGLSWEMILKREKDYDLAYEGFNPHVVAHFDEAKIQSLLHDFQIIKHEGKIRNSIIQAQVVVQIINEFGSFAHFLWSLVDHKPVITLRSPEVWYETSPLSDLVSQKLKERGMKYVGSKIIQAYLQAIGIINDHDTNCYLCMQGENHAESNT